MTADADPRWRFETKAIHAGTPPDPATGAIMTPVYLTSTYVQEAPGVHKGFDYARTNHPTRAALERNLAALEGAEWGLAFASGMAAESTILHALRAGDHVVSFRDLYGGTYRLFTQVFEKLGLEFTFVNELGELEAALRPRTRIVWIETPSNPQLRIVDIAAAAKIARARGAKLVVDNTFATPYLQEPLALGADLVVHSTTKYLGGHSDVVGGAIVGRDPADFEPLKFLQNAVGAVPGPLDCFLVLRGIKTLAVRMERHCANAARIAQFLARHPEVERVQYPGLPSHAGHEVARRQMPRGFGGMVTLELKGGWERGLRLASKTKVFSLAESLGGVESLVGHPTSMTHGSIPPEERAKGGLTEAMVRLSVGIENVDDLLEDLSQAIEASR